MTDSVILKGEVHFRRPSSSAFSECSGGFSYRFRVISRYMTDMELVGINLDETPIVVKATGFASGVLFMDRPRLPVPAV